MSHLLELLYVDLNCIPAQQCLSTSVHYQCTVTDSNIVLWRIRDENMTSLGTEDYTTGSDLVTTPAPFPNSLPFFTDYTDFQICSVFKRLID